MKEIKKLYVIEWSGPYASIDELWDDDKVEECSIYLITGREKHERSDNHIKYVGITERDPANRVNEKDHRERQSKIVDKRFWMGRFSRISNKKQRSHAELIETLFIRFLSLQDVRILNDKKKKKVPDCPLAVVNRWGVKYDDKHRLNKPSALNVLPDVLMFDGEEYWGAKKLVRLNSEDIPE
jgi:hypothetical protein